MNKHQRPQYKEPEITVTIKKREAAVLTKLRQMPNGEAIIRKADGLIVHLKITKDNKIDDNDHINL